VLFMALWWAWSYTAWATGWIDPDRLPVVALLAVLMVASLVMGASLLQSFDGRGAAFALAYVALGLLRNAFMVWAAGTRTPLGRGFTRLLGLGVLSGVLWILGGELADAHARLLVWAVAALIDLMAPAIGHGGAATRAEAAEVSAAHLAERCQLLLMIAFGESFLRLGEAWAAHRGTVGSDGAFVVGFLLVFAVWSVYFLHHAEAGERLIGEAGEAATSLARSAYMYAHAMLVGGVIAMAVAIHRAIEAPAQAVTPAGAGLCIGGPVACVVGLALSKRWLGHGAHHRWPLFGALALGAVGLATSFSTQLVELVAVTVVAGVVAARAWASS
ncbi:MAG TPA: low temperature requirement protein A, partial [Solirubrobacteraceae bacterium]|nr:low temperature requirement protein A [Solirubrobacteraceae bacterium]